MAYIEMQIGWIDHRSWLWVGLLQPSSLRSHACSIGRICAVISSSSGLLHHSQKYNQVIVNRLHWIIRLDLCVEMTYHCGVQRF